jgi:hypothetical protein
MVAARNPTDFNAAVLDISMTRADIEEYMRRLFRAGHYPTFFSISGFDDDPRDLWEIPETLELFDRMWECGFVSLLQPNVPGYDEYEKGFFGALQLWAAQKRKINQPLDNKDMQDFVAEYTEACLRGNRICKPHDGPNRTRAVPRK